MWLKDEIINTIVSALFESLSDFNPLWFRLATILEFLGLLKAVVLLFHVRIVYQSLKTFYIDLDFLDTISQNSAEETVTT